MKAILWLDVQILKFFAKITKDFNWLTGKDNFFLARVVAITICFKTFYFYGKPFWIYDLFFSILLANAFLVKIKFTETFAIKEQQTGIKSLGRHIANNRARAFYWFLSALMWLVLIHWLDYYDMAFSINLGLVASYFMSLDKPPFHKSQAWQKIKGLFGSMVTQPNLEPVPVQSD